MNDTVRDTLKKLIAQYGADLCANRTRLEGLLRDFCGQHRGEINVLVTAVREGVAEELRKVSGGQMDALLFHRLVRRLCDDAGIAQDNAEWAVRSWAVALGKTAPQQRQRQTPTPAPSPQPPPSPGPTAPPPAPTPQPQPIPPVRPPARPRRGWMWAVVIGALLLGLPVGVSLMKRPQERPQGARLPADGDTQTNPQSAKPPTNAQRGDLIQEILEEEKRRTSAKPPTNALPRDFIAQFGLGEKRRTPAKPPTSAKRGDTWTNPVDGAVMVFIPAGEFIMGSNEYDDEKPPHKVSLDGYWIYKYEVTVAQYRKFCEATGRQMPPAPKWGWKDDHPIVQASWHDAVAYCQWAGVRLPTEAEWEKAARGSDGRAYPWGNEWDASRCNNYETGLKQTTAVGSYAGGESPYGIQDMVGNVWEWCADWYGENYYKSAPNRNPMGPSSGQGRVLRGGAWYYDGVFVCRAAGRDRNAPGVRYYLGGFRCAQSR